MNSINCLITNFSVNQLNAFFRNIITSYKLEEVELDYLFAEDVFNQYKSIDKVGEAKIDKDDLIEIATKINDFLNECTRETKRFIGAVDKILQKKKEELDTTELALQIDIMPYKHHNLTHQEGLAYRPSIWFNRRSL